MNEALKRARWVYGIGAFVNFAATIPAFVAYHSSVHLFAPMRAPNYPFLVWIWAGMAFLWGISFVEIAYDANAAYPIVKYTWLEKCITSVSVFIAFVISDVKGRFFLGICVTDVIWIPLFIWVHVGLARARQRQNEGSFHDANR
jgi:hypothetical protein